MYNNSKGKVVMVTQINIVLDKKNDFYSHFNDTRISRELSNYIIEECYGEPINNKIVINIYHSFPLKNVEKEKMQEMLKQNYRVKIQDEQYYLTLDHSKEILLFGLGIILLILYYTFLKNITVISEIILIIGWLAIWEGTYNFLFVGYNKKNKITRLKRLMKAEIKFWEN